jgi:dephospho-CoA kinase
MKIIGLSGGIGSGKSTVSAILKELGAVVIDSDQVAHEVRDRSVDEVVRAFGPGILTPEGTIDRKKLSRVVFHDSRALLKLNGIIHPKVDQEIFARLEKLASQGVPVVFIEVPLLSKAEWYTRADQIWVVKSSREITLKRLRQRGMTEQEALARMAAQTPPEEHVKHGLVIINNDGSLQDLRAKVEKLWKEIHNKDREDRDV